MFNKILLACEPVESNQVLLEQGWAFAELWNAQLMVMSVLTADDDSDIVDTEIGILTDSYSLNNGAVIQGSLCMSSSQENVAVQADRLATARGLSTEVRQRFGNPGRAICDLAKAWGSDLIIVGNHPRTSLQSILQGSISNYVTHHAPCSVLVVRNQITLG